MYNCVIVKRNERPVAIFHSIDAAEMYINVMKEKFGHLDIQWNADWAFIENLPF